MDDFVGINSVTFAAGFQSFHRHVYRARVSFSTHRACLSLSANLADRQTSETKTFLSGVQLISVKMI